MAATTRLARARLAREQLAALYRPGCHLCEIRCGVDRAAGQRGDCGLAQHTPIYRRLLHLGEERELVPSLAVWLAGCNFLCSFCSDEPALRPPLPGRVMTAGALATALVADVWGTSRRVNNINFVGGEPAISLPYLAEVAIAVLEALPSAPDLLLNTNGYLTPGALHAAIDLFDVFVVDLKFGNDDCAAACGAATPYVSVLERNLSKLASSDREVWVRHLLMPGHIDCCTRPALECVSALPGHVRLNVMPAFVSFAPEWGSLSTDEATIARGLVEALQRPGTCWDGKILANA